MRVYPILAILILIAGCAQQQGFKGVPLSPAKPAPDFTLTNQFGERVSLSDFRGRVVVISFLYTSCPTVCPAITQNFIRAMDELGDSVGRDVVFVAVSVDPERDTVERVREYSEKRGLLHRWQYLTGERAELEKVWKDYNIYVNVSWQDDYGNYLVDHTATAIIVDKEGNLRLVYPGITWDPKNLAHDVKLLMRE